MERTARRVQPVTYRRSRDAAGYRSARNSGRSTEPTRSTRTSPHGHQTRPGRSEQSRRPERSAQQQQRMRFGAVEIGVLVAVSIVVLVMIGMPLRNYFQQRSDIARVNASIAEKQAEQQALLKELEKYESEAFIKEQARVRLGVVEPGETAFRILSPELEAESSTGQAASEKAAEHSWYEILWESIATSDSDIRIGLPEEDKPVGPTGNLPISPTQPPPEPPAP
ncbi:MAG: septum formation initiator family protein [Corynebacterium sp.]|nr:septum formation initiator family protein [Corynebacterium sp.]